jgi:cysteine-rich repeat protein
MKHALLLMFAACSFPDLVHRDAGGDGPDANPSSVRGTSILQHHLLDGSVVMAPEDLSRYTIKAYLPNSDDTFTVVDVTGTAQGTFEIPNVPPGTTYYLSLVYPEIINQPTPPPELIVSDERELELGYPTVGRPDATEVRLASTVSLNLTNLVPWTDYDYFNVDSFNTGTEVPGLGTATNLPTAGATTTTNMSFDWRDGINHVIGRLPSLLDATRGDDLFVSQSRIALRHTGRATYATIQEIAVAKITDLVQSEGAPLTVNGALVHNTLDKTMNLTVGVEQFRSYLRDRTRITNEGVQIDAVLGPITQYQTTIGTGPWSMSIGYPGKSMRGIPDSVVLPALAYGDAAAYPTAWNRVLVTNYQTFRTLRLPGSTSAAGILPPIVTYTALSGSSASSTPIVRPTAALRIAGVTETGEPRAVAFDGTHGVVVDWDAVTDADGYQLIVDHVYLDGARTTGKRIALVRTRETRMVLPPDLFERGERYLVGVYSVKGIDEAGQRRFRLPYGFAGVASNALLFSDACGNGVMETDLGEECDTSGASATCDADCSLPICGDVIHNTFTSEACDTGADSPSCDRDCTPVVCGDNLWNQMAEDCDDGNTVMSANGCSATCTRVGTCGDNTVQGFFETCEPPNTASCGPDCQSL